MSEGGSFYPLTVFRFCPQCGSAECEAATIKLFRCRTCGFRYFQNAAAAVVAIIRNERGELLFVRRGREPAKGKLDLPGGFVDPLESAEDALVREVEEETGLKIGAMRFMASFPNRYDYAGVTYYTTDLVFLCDVADLAPLSARDEIEGVVFIAPGDIEIDEIGLPSIRTAIRAYLDHLNPTT